MVYARRLSVAASLLAFCSCFSLRATASTFNTSGTFAADNSTYEYTFTDPGAAIFTASTSSFATGGFVPVLTLFNDTTGNEIDNNGTGFGDASLNDVLGPGTYDLFLTEFPNVAINNLADGFLFAGDPTITGDSCGVAGGTFYNTATAPCTQTSGNYALSATTAPTPEPATWLLVLAPAAYMVFSQRRRNA